MVALSGFFDDAGADDEIVAAVRQLSQLRGLLKRDRLDESLAEKTRWQIAGLERWLANARRLAA